MLMFTLAISCLTISNLPWLMDLTFQVPRQYCSLQHWTLLPSPVSSTAGCCFCFGSISSFFLELFLHWSPVAYWAPTTWGVHLSVSYLFVFHTFILFVFMGLWRQEYWSGVPLPSPERMKRQRQSKNNTQLWRWLVMEVRPNAVKRILHRNLEC